MALIHDKRTPTIEDAREAAAHLARILDPAEVLLFGSVAHGSPTRNSDLDLVVVFDDLGDYTARRELAWKAIDAVAEATGFGSDVRITDRPEWEIRAKHCRSTFEAHIAGHALSLTCRPPKTPINWDKEIGMAPTDEQQAADSLDNTTHALDSLLPLLNPSTHESDALLVGDLSYADRMRHSRMLNICSQSQTVMETSLKALIHALKGPHPENIHSIGGLINAARPQLSDIATAERKAALGPLSSEQATVWRETSTYPADRRIKGGPVLVVSAR